MEGPKEKEKGKKRVIYEEFLVVFEENSSKFIKHQTLGTEGWRVDGE